MVDLFRFRPALRMLGLDIAVIKRVAVTVDDGDLQKLVYGRIKARRLGVHNDKVNGVCGQRLLFLFLPFLFFCCFHDRFMMALTIAPDKIRRVAVTVDTCIVIADKIIVKSREDASALLIERPIIIFIDVVVQHAVFDRLFQLRQDVDLIILPENIFCRHGKDAGFICLKFGIYTLDDLFLVIDLCSRHLHFCRLFCFFDGSFYVLSYVVHDAIDHNRMRRE